MLSSGWDFTTADRNVCDPGFDYKPAWTGCGTNFGVRYHGTIRLEESGTHCFAIAGGTDAQCGALFVAASDDAITPLSGTTCFELHAGLYPIEWFYETTSTSLNVLHVLHAYCGASSCTPNQPIPSASLRPDSDATERVCPGECTELCPCSVGAPVSDVSQCLPGLVLRSDVAESFGLPSGTPVCWDPVCDDRTSELFECGTPTARCGTACPSCDEACWGASCGYNGCWGKCGDGLCADGEEGCESDADCESGLTCILPLWGYGVCRPSHCASPGLNPCSDPANAEQQTECGTCPPCFTDCGTNTCEPGPGQYCTPEGTLRDRSQVLLSPVTVPVDGPETAGTLPGQIEVNDTGQATYTIPLQLPPGRAGIEPHLALAYNSSAGNGYLGMGWGLTGLSAIQRCPKTIAQDDELGGITYTDADRFCLDGQRLVLQDSEATYGADGTYYRTEIETFSRIQIVGYDTEPAAFEVRTRDGRILTYATRIGGNTPLTGLRPPNYHEEQSNDVRSQTWALTSVQDRLGNRMEIDYFIPAQCKYSVGLQDTEACDPVVGGTVREYYPQEIRYTSADRYGVHLLDSDRFVRFKYHPRKDILRGYQYGVRFERTQLLDTIVAYVEGQIAFLYELQYDEPESDDALHERSLLHSVKQFARSSVDPANTGLTAIPATVFSYAAVEPGFQKGDSLVGGGLPDVSDADADFVGRPITLDVDGNGQDDVLYPVCADPGGSACTKLAWHLLLNGEIQKTQTGDEPIISSWSRMVPEGVLAEVVLGWLSYRRARIPASSYAVDLDLDGRDELLEIDVAFRKGTNGSAIKRWVWNDETRTFEKTVLSIGLEGTGTTGLETGERDGLYLLDADGDGGVDLLDCTPVDRETGHWTLRRGDRTGSFGPPELSTAAGPRCLPGSVVDLNGDGAQELLLNTLAWKTSSSFDIMIFREEPRPADVFWPTTGETTAGILPASDASNFRTLLDTNGDGLSDAVDFADHHRVRVWTNTGSGFIASEWQTLDMTALEPHYDGSTFLLQLHRFGTPFDENGDGRTDLLVRVANDRWATLRSRGGISTRLFDVVPLDARIGPHQGNQFALADNDHDGVTDLIDQVQVWTRRGSAVPRLTAVTNGLGARSAVQYADLSRGETAADSDAPALYAGAASACSYPCYARHPRGAVVRRTYFWDVPTPDAENLPMASRVFRYGYGGAATDLNGRGSLGFAARQMVDETRESVPGPNAGNLSLRIYENTRFDAASRIYPTVGAPVLELVATHTSTGRVRGMVTTREISVSRSAAHSVFVHTDQTRTKITEGDGEPSSSPLVLQDVESIYDYDAYGNQVATQQAWKDSHGAVTETVFVDTPHLTDTEHVQEWIVSQPQTRRVESDRNGIQVRVDSYSYFEQSFERPDLAYSGLPERIIQDPNTPAELAAAFDYDDFGNPTEIASTGLALGAVQNRTTTLSYDEQHMFPVSVVDDAGHEVQQSHDPALGTLLSTKELLRPDPNGDVYVTRFSISDGFGRLRQLIDPDGNATTIAYEALSDGGYQSVRTRPGAPSETVVHDVLGRETERTFDSLQHQLTTRTTYTALGLPATVSRAKASGTSPATLYTYDALDRPLTEVLPDGSTVEHCYRDAVSCTRTARGYPHCTVVDEHGAVVFSVDPLPGLTEACQDAANAVAAEFPFDGAQSPNTDRVANHYRYGPFGTLLALANPQSVETTFTYDNRNRALSQTDPSRGHWQWTYNAFGETETETDGEGLTASFEYDELGRLVTRTDLDPGGTSGIETEWSYDDGLLPGAYGRPTASISPDGVSRFYGYDSSGRLNEVQASVPDADGQLQGMRKQIVYDARGRLSLTTYGSPNGSTAPFRVRNRYNSQGYVDLVYGTANPDPEASFSAGEDTKYWQADLENDFGELTSESFGNGFAATRTFDSATGRLTSARTARGAVDALNYSSYTYLPDGNIDAIDDAVHGEHTSHVYDELDRLVHVTTNGIVGIIREEAFTYHPTGNIATRSISEGTQSAMRTYHYPDPARPDRLDTITEGTTQVGRYSGYDGNGNVVYRSWTAGTEASFLTTTYNRRAMPGSITSGVGEGAVTVDYGYDADGVRAFKRDNFASGEETFYLDDAYQRSRVVGSSGLSERLVVFAAGRAVAELTRPLGGTLAQTQTRYLHEDHLGSIAAITNEEGEVVERRRYEPFGKRRAVDPAEAGSTRRDFTGHEYDPEFGLVNMKARFYDPEVGRFLQTDPVFARPGWSQGPNAYSYAANNPLAFTDSDGRFFDCAAGCPGTAIAVGIGTAVVVGAFIYGGIKSGSFEEGWEDAKETASDIFKGIGSAAKAIANFFDPDDQVSRGSAKTVDARTETGSSIAPVQSGGGSTGGAGGSSGGGYDGRGGEFVSNDTDPFLGAANDLDNLGVDDALAGFADAVTNDQNAADRDLLGIGDTVDVSSHAYANGRKAGRVFHIGMAVAGTIKEVPDASAVPKGASRAKNKLAPHPDAQGPHTTFKRGPDGKVSGYQTWKRSDPRNPKPWSSEKRVDVTGDPHYNKATGQDVPTPHVQSRDIPGGVRPAEPWEIPLR